MYTLVGIYIYTFRPIIILVLNSDSYLQLSAIIQTRNDASFLLPNASGIFFQLNKDTSFSY
jgi:hypothetical protein